MLIPGGYLHIFYVGSFICSFHPQSRRRIGCCGWVGAECFSTKLPGAGLDGRSTRTTNCSGGGSFEHQTKWDDWEVKWLEHWNGTDLEFVS